MHIVNQIMIKTGKTDASNNREEVTFILACEQERWQESAGAVFFSVLVLRQMSLDLPLPHRW